MDSDNIKLAIDVQRDRYPYCIVWSPLPVITWILPFVGHTGICNSEGVIFDFAGPYTIGVGRMAFGSPTRYIRLDPSRCRELGWDQGILEGCQIYEQRMHNICWDNCHNHVGKCLALMAYSKSLKLFFALLFRYLLSNLHSKWSLIIIIYIFFQKSVV